MEDQLDRSDDVGIAASLDRYGGERVYVAGTQHMDFSDLPLLPPLHRGRITGPIAPERVQTILRGTVVGFFDRELLGKDVREPGFAEVTVERYGAGVGHTASIDNGKSEMPGS
jgi:hypothetical protein